MDLVVSRCHIMLYVSLVQVTFVPALIFTETGAKLELTIWIGLACGGELRLLREWALTERWAVSRPRQ